MGNCFACLKVPSTTAAQGNALQQCHKEEMPESLYPASSHVPASAPPETILSNGNHLPCGAGLTDSSIFHPLTTTSTLAASTTTTTTTTIRFYTSSRKLHSKSAPGVMGASESKQPSDTKLNALFDQYKDADEDAILAEGIEQLCKDLQVSPDDFKVLILAWKLQAEQMCRFTRKEFVVGLRGIRADSIRAIQTRLPELVGEVDTDDELFKDLYRFTFKFGLDSAAGQRSLSTDMAIVLWRLVFTVREPPILSRWLRFLESHGSIRGIPRDTWNMFLNFAEFVGADLSSYDDSEAWPTLFDDFVEYENDQANQNITKKDCGEDDGLLIQ